MSTGWVEGWKVSLLPTERLYTERGVIGLLSSVPFKTGMFKHKHGTALIAWTLLQSTRSFSLWIKNKKKNYHLIVKCSYLCLLTVSMCLLIWILTDRRTDRWTDCLEKVFCAGNRALQTGTQTVYIGSLTFPIITCACACVCVCCVSPASINKCVLNFL